MLQAEQDDLLKPNIRYIRQGINEFIVLLLAFAIPDSILQSRDLGLTGCSIPGFNISQYINCLSRIKDIYL